jgi:hypothetical protein
LQAIVFRIAKDCGRCDFDIPISGFERIDGVSKTNRPSPAAPTPSYLCPLAYHPFAALAAERSAAFEENQDNGIADTIAENLKSAGAR